VLVINVSGRGLTKPDEPGRVLTKLDERGRGLTKPDEAAISDLSLLQFGISLLPWRHFEIRVLQPLLATCDALASTQPQSVLATLFALVHSDAGAGLTLKFGAPAGPCALALCLALETALAPITARGGGGASLSATERQHQARAERAHHGASAHHGAHAHHGARQAWAALKVLAATRSPQLGSLLPRILTAVRALLTIPADALECSDEAEGGAHDGAPSPAGLLLHAAALEALTSLTASAEGAFTAPSWAPTAEGAEGGTAANAEVPSSAAVGAKRSRAAAPAAAAAAPAAAAPAAAPAAAAATAAAAAAAAPAATASKKRSKKGALEAALDPNLDGRGPSFAPALPNLGMGDIEAALRCLLYPPALTTARQGGW